MSVDGVQMASVLDGNGGARTLDAAGVQAWKPGDGVLWLHLDYKHEKVRKWLTSSSGIGEASCEALLEEEPRPRATARGAGLLAILRGANCNSGADVVDMVSLRMWVEPERVITLRHRPVMAARDVAEELARKEGPRSSGELLARLSELVADRIATAVDQVEDDVDALEDQALTDDREELRSRIAEVRRDAIALRRYLAPQRDVWSATLLDRIEWIALDDRQHLREAADRSSRFVESIDAVRERAAIVQDILNGRASEQMNRNLYAMSLVAAVFLPLSLLTGLLGINVGGMPGIDSPLAFWIVCALLVVTGIGEVWVLRRLRWI